MNASNTSLLLRQDGSIARCDDGSVIIQFTTTVNKDGSPSVPIQRCCILDPIKNRQVVLQLFGPMLFNKIITKEDGSSTSGIHGPESRTIWNETTVTFLLECLRLHRVEYMANFDTTSLYNSIALMMNSQEFEHTYTPEQCYDKISALVREYAFQLYRNFHFENVEGEKNDYFEQLHDILGQQFGPPEWMHGDDSDPANKPKIDYKRISRDKKFAALLNELMVHNMCILKRQKNSLVLRRRVQAAFDDLLQFIDELREENDETNDAAAASATAPAPAEAITDDDLAIEID